MRWRTLPAAAVGTGLGAVGVRAAGRAASALIERRVNRTFGPVDAPVSGEARDVHSRLAVVDLHADSLLWGRDLCGAGSAAMSTSRD